MHWLIAQSAINVLTVLINSLYYSLTLCGTGKMMMHHLRMFHQYSESTLCLYLLFLHEYKNMDNYICNIKYSI